MSQLTNSERDASIVDKYKRNSIINQEAEKLRMQGDADSLVSTIRDVAEARTKLATAIDLATPHRRAKLLMALGVTVVAATATWATTWPDGASGLPVYGAFALTAIGAVMATLGWRRIREVKRLDRLLPSEISATEVSDAHQFIGTFGELHGYPSSAILGIAAAAEGGLAGWILGQAYSNAVPVVVQLGFALGAAVIVVLCTSFVADIFSLQVKRIRARNQVRALERMDYNKLPQKQEETRYFAEQVKSITGGSHKRPDWKLYCSAAASLSTVTLPFAALAWIRLQTPDAASIPSAIVITFSGLCACVAILGCLGRAFSPLLPERHTVAAMTKSRFPTLQAFASWQAEVKKSVESWANSVIRDIRNSYGKRIDDGCMQAKVDQVLLADPFPTLRPATAPIVREATDASAAAPTTSEAGAVTPTVVPPSQGSFTIKGAMAPTVLMKAVWPSGTGRL